mgnify:CR=1 FL=1
MHCRRRSRARPKRHPSPTTVGQTGRVRPPVSFVCRHHAMPYMPQPHQQLLPPLRRQRHRHRHRRRRLAAPWCLGGHPQRWPLKPLLRRRECRQRRMARRVVQLARWPHRVWARDPCVCHPSRRSQCRHVHKRKTGEALPRLLRHPLRRWRLRVRRPCLVCPPPGNACRPHRCPRCNRVECLIMLIMAQAPMLLLQLQAQTAVPPPLPPLPPSPSPLLVTRWVMTPPRLQRVAPVWLLQTASVRTCCIPTAK